MLKFRIVANDKVFFVQRKFLWFWCYVRNYADSPMPFDTIEDARSFISSAMHDYELERPANRVVEEIEWSGK